MRSRVVSPGVCLFAAAVALVATFGCDQPDPKCAAGRSPFATRYRVVSGPPSCADLVGEELGISTYNAEGSENRQPNLDRASIAIQALGLGLLVENAKAAGLADPNPGNRPYATGAFTTSEPVDDFCAVPTLAPATQSLPQVEENAEEDIAAQPATVVTYAWSNVRFYVTATAYGTQMTGDLVLTRDGVECVYSVLGLSPYVPCGVPDPADETREIPDDSACDAAPNAAEGRPTGSGINPDFPVRCDPELLVCFLARDTVPALR